MTIGWWDNCAPWSWADHAQIAARPAWALNEWLLLEDIDHENNSFAKVPYAEDDNPVTSAEARAEMFPRYLDPALEFFDIFLRGVGSPADLPRVRWKVAGEDELHAAPSWPPPGAVVGELYASADGRLRGVPEPGPRPRASGPTTPTRRCPRRSTTRSSSCASSPTSASWPSEMMSLPSTATAAESPLLLAGPIGAARDDRLVGARDGPVRAAGRRGARTARRT